MFTHCTRWILVLLGTVIPKKEIAMDTRQLHEELRRDEGFSAKSYLDSRRVITIGIGHAMATGPISKGTEEDLRRAGFFGRAWPVDALTALFNADVERHVRELRVLCTEHDVVLSDFSDARQRALANMCFNMGPHGLAQFRKMWEAISGNDWQEAARQALDSRWAAQVGIRATRIADMLRDG